MEKQKKFEQIHSDNRSTTDYILKQETDHKLNIVSDCLSRYTGIVVIQECLVVIFQNILFLQTFIAILRSSPKHIMVLYMAMEK